ncbi:MAG: SRPBCC family protein [Actinobacteria bacterium]|nr:MAG: SRPBCC family protein [Actinomycetota bacterium]
MLTLKDTVEIGAEPQVIEDWLRNIDLHYREWHPDHIKWVNLDGILDEGKTFYYEEYLGSRILKSKCRITRLQRNGEIVIAFKGLAIHERILGLGGSFVIAPRDESCLVTATISLRFGWLITRLFKGMVEAIQTHMREEGENLKRILES